METKLEIFMGIMSFICFALFISVVVARAVKWVQQWYTRKRNREEIDKMLRRQALRRAMDRMPNNDSAIDMALDPKPWGHLPVGEQKYVTNCLNCGEVRHFAPYNGPGAADRACTECGLGLWTKEAQERGMKPMDIMPGSTDEFQKQGRLDRAEQIVEAPHTMWCPRCGSHKKHLAHAVGGIPHHKCEDCGQRYKQSPTQNQVVNRYDRNAIPTDTPSASSQELHGVLDSEGHWPGVIDFMPNKGGWNDTQDEPVTFGGGDFGGSGAGDSYETPRDSDSTSTDTSNSSDYSSSNDD